ncbi:uncharacterized protein B0H18DRAFT_614686 [Fomitopsis serialis]|uniref:uncharacterized protein n=1 Tax=Fomitopsis serialis TaxID=139415 RepID=UPI0020082166|nr:uncharacterized protein B0H18DRAFT_614686 [Neoantrodia serialis]KAH9920176.1 hypothetical protein B0H18DRAFT_614686 [Neoantrodia serialis]
MMDPRCETARPLHATMLPDATQNMGVPYSDAILGENVEEAHTFNHSHDLRLCSLDPPSREGLVSHPPGLPARPPGLPARSPGVPLRPPGLPSPRAARPAYLSGLPTRPRGIPTRPPGLPAPARPPGLPAPARPPGLPSPRRGFPAYPFGISWPHAEAHRIVNQPSRTSDASSWSPEAFTTAESHDADKENVPPPVGGQYTFGRTNAARHLPAQPAFQSGAILNPVWTHTARVGLGDAARPDTRPLEPVGQYPAEDPAWAGGLTRSGRPMAPRSAQPMSSHYDAAIGTYQHSHLEAMTWTDGFLTRHWIREEAFRIQEERWVAAENARVPPPMEPVLLKEHWPCATAGLLLLPAEHDDSGSDSGYSSSGDLSALDDIMPGLAGLGELVGLDDDASKALSNDGYVACGEIVEE